jgi:hypothetical protein
MNQVMKPPIKCIGVTLADLNAGMCKWVLAEGCASGSSPRIATAGIPRRGGLPIACTMPLSRTTAGV